MKLIIPIIFIIAAAGAFVLLRRSPEAVSPTRSQPSENAITYLPLGDSYTIGQSVRENERWPNQLVTQLRNKDIELVIVGNPSRTGYTTQDLIDVELPVLRSEKPEFVTVLIGVNDWVQGVDAPTFRKNLAFILDEIVATVPKAKVLLVTIPDFGKTPSGSSFGRPDEIASGIASFNAIILEEATSRNLPVADIYTVSQAVPDNPALVAPDGLHPSGKQYTQWTEVILPVALQLFKP